jgi:ankyrin repeat protein
MNKVRFFLIVMLGFAHLCAANDYSKMSADEFKQALMEVITQNNQDEVSKILAHPKAKNFNEDDLREALVLAAENNYVNIAHKLIQAGADIKEKYCFALKHAAEKGHIDMVKALLPVQGCDKRAHYMDVNYLNAHRDDALIAAARNGHADVMREIINAGANVNYQNTFGQIALVEAAKSGSVDAVKVLLQARANVKAFDSNGYTALIIAKRLGNADLIRLLSDSKN